MRTAYSYIRLTLASWMFLGGVAIQFLPSAAAVARDDRQRERILADIPRDDRTAWLRQHDLEDAQSEAYLRLFGVLLGGVGFAMALFETAFICARSSRHCPLDAV